MVVPLILLVSFSLVLGGGTTNGFGSDVLIQLMSVGALAYMMVAMPSVAAGHLRSVFQSGAGKSAVGLVCGLISVHLIQLVPLPETWMAAAPLSRGEVSGTVSRVPHATGAALASLLPPIAVFVLTAACTLAHRKVALSALVFVGLASLLVGFLQVIQGPGSALRFFDFTNRLDAVGFFANRNHFAALLCVLLALVCVWLLSLLDRVDRLPMITATGALACLVAVLTGIMLARSRAGTMLAMVVLGSTIILYLLEVRRPAAPRLGRTSSNSRWLVAGLFIAVLIAVQLGLGRVLSRFEVDPLDDLRWTLTERGFSLATSGLPFGTGIGSFVQSYATFEHTADLFRGFANRAHNDWVEFAIEGGLPAVLLMVCFLIWFGSRALSRPRQPGRQRQQHTAGVLIVVILLLHSLVDYPLRTTAIATVFAFACALLMPPLSDVGDEFGKEVDDTHGASLDAVHEGTTGTWSPVKDTHDWPDSWRRE